MQHPKIAACLILKDSAETIEACLETIRPYVDAIFIYDTGSTDGTQALLAELNKTTQNAKTVQPDGTEAGGETLAPIFVTQGEWRDDFSWARQQNWDSVPEEYDWMFWLDDDDIVVGAPNIRGLALTAPSDLDGYVCFYDYARDQNDNCVCQLWRERLMRRAAGYIWKGAVHEVLIPADGREPRLGTLPPQVLRYIHKRPLDRYEPTRNLKILEAIAEKETAEHGGPLPRTLAYLGTEWMAKSQFDQAIPFLQTYLQHPDAGWSDERAQVRHKLAICFRAMASPQAAVHVEFEGIKERDDWTENIVGLAGAFAELGEWKRAEEWAKRAIQAGMPQSPLILNPMEHELLPLLIAADACLSQQKFEEAQQAVTLAAEKYPLPDVQAKKESINQQVQRAEIIGAVLMLRETLVRHDENLKAWNLMQAVPYLIEDDPMIVHAKAAQREDVLHALKPEEYRRWYEDVPKESTIDDEHVEEIDQFIERPGFTYEGLQEQEKELGRKPKVLDMGGNDMWMACYLWKKGGYHVDGIELNKSAVEKGLARMERFDAPGRLIQGDIHDAYELLGLEESSELYDAVTMYEVLEHVPDPEEALRACESVLTPEGRVYVTTPAGAFERGAIDGWSVVERKGHLRALTPSQFATMLTARGEVDDYRVHHADGRLTFARYKPGRPKGDVVFYAGGSFESWSPVQIKAADEQGRVGLGGSETALAQVAMRMSQGGYRVRVYSGSDEGLFGGALYLPFTAFDPTEESDLLIVSRMPHIFDNPLGAKRTAIWCHDHSYPGIFTEERAAKIDSILVLSAWQKRRFAKLYPFAKKKLVLLRNGISFYDIGEGNGKPGLRYPNAERGFEDREPRVVYSSSADRGLDVLLGIWPRIRQAVPDAQLHVYYGFDVLERVAHQNKSPELLAYRSSVLRTVDDLGGEDGGIFMHGRVGQLELSQEMQLARVWGYPTAFLETSCIGAMESRAAGLAIVTSDLGALSETVGKHGHLIPWADDEEIPQNRTQEYQDEFLDRVVAGLVDPVYWRSMHARALSHASQNDWSHRIAAWEALVNPAPAPKRKRAVARV